MSAASPLVVAVTGASSGIGAAIARAAAREGAWVSIAARRTDRLAALAAELEGLGGRGLAVACDVTRHEDVEAFVARTIEAFGHLDVMVANAGIGYHGPFESTPDTVVRRLIDVNLIGTFLAARAALAPMKRQGHGHVIVISSIVGRRGIGGSAVYSATKAAQVAFVESLRAECLGTGIRASVVLPVSTTTEFHQAIERDFGHRVAGRGPRQSADTVARAVMQCIRSPRPEVYPHRWSRLLAVANVVSPGLTDRLVQRFGRRQVSASESHDSRP